MPPTPPSVINARSDRNGQFSPALSSYPGSPAESRFQVFPTESQLCDGDEDEYRDDDAPPYASADGHSHRLSQGQVHVESNSSVQYGLPHAYPDQAAYQRQPFPHSMSSPYIPSDAALSPPPLPSPVVMHSAVAGPAPLSPPLARVPTKRSSRRRSNGNQLASQAEVQRYSHGTVYRLSSGYPQGPGGLSFAIPDDGRSTPSLMKKPSGVLERTYEVPMQATAATPPLPRRQRRDSQRRQSSNLHPYVMTFTSPIGKCLVCFC